MTIVVPIEGPLLGLATTRQLLEELQARGETEDRHPAIGRLMAAEAKAMLDYLPARMLAYRTVDSS